MLKPASTVVAQTRPCASSLKLEMGFPWARRQLLHTLPIVAVQPTLGTDPDVTCTVFEQAGDHTVAQAIGRGEVLEAECLASCK